MSSKENDFQMCFFFQRDLIIISLQCFRHNQQILDIFAQDKFRNHKNIQFFLFV